MDRGYAKFALFNKILAAKSSYVCRLRDSSVYEVIEERPPSEADRKAGVLSDQIVRFTNGKPGARRDHPIRLVCVKCSPHTTRGKYGGGSSGVDSDGILRTRLRERLQLGRKSSSVSSNFSVHGLTGISSELP